MNSKPWYKSKTMWFNIISAILVSIEAIMAEGLVGDSIEAVFMYVIILGNAVLRLFTHEPVQGSPASMRHPSG